ncbi:MAG: phosphoribosylformylglycinamidine synthase subunit PurL [Elusimicrobia bacterium]|nr:phosphoribosylformylglycinamidine synthase subunit PurL [Elusimicrobiota bacterium]
MTERRPAAAPNGKRATTAPVVPAARGQAPADEGLRFTTLPPKELKELNAKLGWSLNDVELEAIRAHFKKAGREPSRGEVETIAQTWSEHCKHKTFNGPVRYSDGKKSRVFRSLFAETIVKATKELSSPWCLSVFKDNAGIVQFGKGGRWALAVKVETHNHPCAVEPYGGAETGIGGVIRDVLGAGLGAKPVLNTDTFCLARPDYSGELPEGALHPVRTLRGVVAGVRDYGNRMGIPTAGGGLWFDDDYRLNPLVFCGTVGILPTWAVRKEVKPGDLIVAVGGPTGRDGLHGATFSSTTMDGETDRAAVQIGHPLNEKRVLDALMVARDRRLYRGVTDCGAGGFSSAIGELARDCGARVELEKAPLKCSDLEPWEIWLSEAQERMVLAVPPKSYPELERLFHAEGTGCSVLGEFTKTGRLVVTHKGARVADLDMGFLHDGMPRVERRAVWTEGSKPKRGPCGARGGPAVRGRLGSILTRMLAHLNVCSREWVIRQYDHEVQAGTVIKPLQGQRHDGPGDACVIWPVAATGDWEDRSGFAVGHGLNPSYGRVDPYWMALCCADEALRNLLCAGADISKASFLDNFCWASPEVPEQLGGLVRAALGCHDAAKGYGIPFISGKDSLYNQSRDEKGRELAIPGTLLITAVAPVPDITHSLTMDFKGPGNSLFLVGVTKDETGGSLLSQMEGCSGEVPKPDPKAAARSFKAVAEAISKKLVLSAHDLSDGGLGVALSEMAFSGEFGASIELDQILTSPAMLSDETILFSESPSRILLEVSPKDDLAVMRALKGVPARRIGSTTANPLIKVSGLDGSVVLETLLVELKAAWQKTLPELLK